MFGKSIISVILLSATSVFSERIAIDATLTNTLTRYAWFASAAYSSDCDIPPFNTTTEKDFSDFFTDTQAKLFRDDAKQELILAFRGTSSIMDVITDFRSSLVDCTPALPLCGNCTCHEGFLDQYLAVQDDIISYLAVKLQDTSYSLTITGHSMGASGASIFATVLRSQGLSLNAYTYGQPRTGNQAYANYVDSLFPLISPSQETNKCSESHMPTMVLRKFPLEGEIITITQRKFGYRPTTKTWCIGAMGKSRQIVMQVSLGFH